MAEMKVIDVSKHQGKIDWNKLKGKIGGAIIRCGYGSDLAKQDDERFKENVEACIQLDIPFGVYLYSYAKTLEGARSEAAHVIRLLAPYKDKLSFPVYYDLEEAGTEKGAVERAIAFGDIIEAEGYWCGIYANQYWWRTVLKNGLERFTKWVAKYSSQKPEIGSEYDMWQHTSSGKLDGINGKVDLNICYRDFPALIKGKVKEPKKENEVIAKEVIAGSWGIGIERKNKLTQAGYDYDAIQAIVNDMLKDDEEVQYYTVKPDETLGAIAKAHGTTYQALAKLNGIANPNRIYIGQKIRIK